MRPTLVASGLAALAALSACGEGGARDPGPPAPLEARPEPAARVPRTTDARCLAAEAAFEAGRGADAGRMLLALADDDLDANLLRARIAAAEGDSIAAVRLIERARAEHPGEARVHATAGEVHALGGRFESAEAEIREGLALAGGSPELSRARGVLAICREGGARVGLNHLLDARAADPELPFLDGPLVEAHLLLARQAMAEEQPLDALGHAQAVLELRPGLEEARLVQADARASMGELAAAVEIYEALLADGADVRDSLALMSQRAATAALVQGERERAVALHLRARELGLSEDDLGFGRTLLAEEGVRAMRAGVAAHEEGELRASATRFERALELDPELLAARNHLAVVRFKLREYSEAVRHWTRVLETARAEGLELPEPVHLNLARALVLNERVDEARELLQREILRDPAGEHANAARALLDEL